MYGLPIKSWKVNWAEAQMATLWHVDPDAIVAHLTEMRDTLGETGPECPTCWAAENQMCLVVGSLHTPAKHTHKARVLFAGAF